jgi:hypothetical protein
MSGPVRRIFSADNAVEPARLVVDHDTPRTHLLMPEDAAAAEAGVRKSSPRSCSTFRGQSAPR